MKHCAALVLLCMAPHAPAAITYIDATPANTVAQGGHTTGAGHGPLDGLWHLRSGAGNSGNVWTADDSAPGEDVPPLVTTIVLPQAGGYRVFAYIWDDDAVGEDWDARVRLAPSSGFSRILGSEAGSAQSADFSEPLTTSEGSRRLIQIPLGVAIVPAGGALQIYVDDDATSGPQRTWFDGVGFERVFATLGERIIAIDCNKTNAAGAPSQALFRSLSGSSTTSQNSTNIVKQVGPHTLHISKSSSTRFDFRGANGDASRLVPGGPNNLSFLVADFLGARDGTINLAISNLSAGPYLFRSYHLDTFNSGNLGFAQGTSPTNQNTLRAHIDGVLHGIVQPTAVSASGLGTNFISNADVPTLAFAFNADGLNPVKINLSTLYPNGVDRFIFINGFEVFSASP